MKVQDAFIMHLRVLWRLLHPNSIPQDPSPEAIERFNGRFRSAAAVNAQRRSDTLLTDVNNVRGAAMIAESPDLNSKIVKTVIKMEDNIIQYMDSCVARVGLEEWGPDFSQSPHALYNSTNRIIALDTFKQAVTSHAYASLKPNLKFVNDMVLLTKLYNHFVHFFFYRRYICERQNPGIIAQEDEANPTYRNRSRVSSVPHLSPFLCLSLIQLAKARAEWLRQNGYPDRYVNLCIPKATSDDERDPEERKISGRPVFFIRTRPERSDEVTRFFRLLDAARERDTRLDPSRRWVERVRIEPAEPIETAFPSIPLHMPVDYFDPDFFNELQPNLRAKAANPSVSLLPDVDQSFTRCEDEHLSDAEFNDKYAAEHLPNYDLFDEDYADDEGEGEGEVEVDI